MKKEKDYCSSQIRLPESVFEQIRKIATETGASQNSVLCMLISDGLRIRNAPISIDVKV